MASTNTITGRLGKFVVGSTLVARTTGWAVNPKLASQTEWGDSDSSGYTNRAEGRKDATFTAEGKFDTGAAVWTLFQPGDTAIAVLWMNTTLYWDFPCALCQDFNIQVDIDTEQVQAWTSAWGADGVFYRPGEAGATTRTRRS